MNRDQTIRGRQTMTKKTMWRGGVAVLSGALFAGALAMSPAQAEAASFAVRTSASTVGVGDQVTVTLAARHVQDVYAYELALDYDESVLAYVPGSASTDVTGSTYASVVDGDLTVLHTKLGTSPAANGDVTLVTATFRALKAGSTKLAVPSLELVVTGGGSTSVDEVEGASLAVDPSAAPTVVKAPKISGSAQVGRVLKVSAGTWSTPGVKTSVQWLRNGKAIAGATGSAHRVTPADFGSKLSAKVTATKAGHRSGSATAKAVKISKKAVSRTKVKAKSAVKARGVWKARVSVAASGVSPRGTVKVIHRGKVVRKVKVVDGKATVSLRLGAKRGKTSVRFVYVPQSGVKASSTTVKVRVR
ncbi:cohesin domain-containing protein [Aeromicrobium duanguangcaii]|uniref:Cohesin domain-containing protein n=1 Tax=Aeromicrobium duanguangcaii TaxID=2968086 RepID=A0ABY5KDV3_9ACTN|nr:cohesin domain-containing protein [Aeromicrobium duanguangcaii]MCD9154469.1 cohesin domain-containing protein [Aeromicrobium duanguangcaii]UUI68474.1 cohesin domain-containing protein [Aeromicrobium duanguangcaii]